MTLGGRISFASATLLALVLGSACGPKDEEDAPLPPAPKFAGKVDPALVGSWRTADGISALVLSKDGAVEINTEVNSRAGRSRSTQKGRWLVDGGRLLLKYPIADGTEQTVGYAMKVAGDTLTLSTKIPKKDTVYKRR